MENKELINENKDLNESNNETSSKEVIEKQRSTFRLFWLFVFIDIALIIGIAYLVIDIFVKSFSK